MSNAIKQKIKNGEPVVISIMGNSIGCGFRADNTFSPNPYNADPFGLLAVGSGTDMANRVTVSGETDNRVKSWAIQIYDYLKSKNENSTIHNVSINGGAIKDHIDTNSVNVITQRGGTDLVILPLAINDALYGGGDYWKSKIRTLIDTIQAKGWEVVLMKENDLYNPVSAGRTLYYEIIQSYDSIASEYGIEVIDGFTPFKTRLDSVNRSWENSGLFYDNIHPNQEGHNMLYQSVAGWMNTSNVNSPVIKIGDELKGITQTLLKQNDEVVNVSKMVVKM